MIGRPRQPPRLREALDESSPLARGLRAAQTRYPDDDAAAAVERRVLAAVGGGLALQAAQEQAQGPTGPTHRGAGLGSAGTTVATTAKVIVGLAISAGAIWSGMRALHHPSVQSSIEVSTHPSAREAAPVGTSASAGGVPPSAGPSNWARPSAPELIAPSVAPAPSQAPLAVASPRPRRVGARTSSPAGGQANRLRRELQLIDPARAALATDPERALSLCAQHQREFPQGGVMNEEREAIIIAALLKQSRLTEARARLDRFEAGYPTSPYTAQLRDGLHPAPTTVTR